MIQFKASIHAVRIDYEGEAKIILAVPSSDLKSVQELQGLTQRVLNVSITEEKD